MGIHVLLMITAALDSRPEGPITQLVSEGEHDCTWSSLPNPNNVSGPSDKIARLTEELRLTEPRNVCMTNYRPRVQVRARQPRKAGKFHMHLDYDLTTTTDTDCTVQLYSAMVASGSRNDDNNDRLELVRRIIYYIFYDACNYYHYDPNSRNYYNNNPCTTTTFLSVLGQTTTTTTANATTTTTSITLTPMVISMDPMPYGFLVASTVHASSSKQRMRLKPQKWQALSDSTTTPQPLWRGTVLGSGPVAMPPCSSLSPYWAKAQEQQARGRGPSAATTTGGPRIRGSVGGAIAASATPRGLPMPEGISGVRGSIGRATAAKSSAVAKPTCAPNVPRGVSPVEPRALQEGEDRSRNNMDSTIVEGLHYLSAGADYDVYGTPGGDIDADGNRYVEMLFPEESAN